MSLFSPTRAERRRALKVGLFAAVALGLAGLVVFFIGKESRLFERQVEYRAYFESVQGLSVGSAVWLGGKEVGEVSAINFPQGSERRLEVRLQLSARQAHRVRADSVVRLESLGLLGDKVADISLGSPEQPAVPPGGTIRTAVGGDLASFMRSASRTLEESEAISHTLREAVEAYADPQLARDVAGSVHNLSALLGEVRNGDGVLHALIYDPEAGKAVGPLLANASRAAGRLDQAAGELGGLLADVRRGPGGMHALIYGPEGAKAVAELGSAAGELSQLLEAARTQPDSDLHQLLYANDGSLLADLKATAANLKDISSTVARGEGSLGGLIKDPAVYENLNVIVGNVRRNKVLRTLVRFSLQRREAAAGAPGAAGRLEAPPESRSGAGPADGGQ